MKFSEILSKVKVFFDKSKPTVEEIKAEVPVETEPVIEEESGTEEGPAIEEEKPVVKSPVKKASKKVTNKTK